MEVTSVNMVDANANQWICCILSTTKSGSCCLVDLPMELNKVSTMKMNIVLLSLILSLMLLLVQATQKKPQTKILDQIVQIFLLEWSKEFWPLAKWIARFQHILYLKKKKTKTIIVLKILTHLKNRQVEFKLCTL